MDFQLIWTDNAIADLRGVVAYYVHEEKSAESALKVGNAIVERVEILRSFPDIGPRYPRVGGAHREIQCYDYRIFYKVDRDRNIVYVARVWHGARNLESLKL
jgi:plasmid stabilization system protein ParE